MRLLNTTPLHRVISIVYLITVLLLLYISQKQLPRKMKSRLVIIECAGYIFWQLFLWRLYYPVCCSWDLTQTLLNGALLLFLRLDPNAIERSNTIVLETWPKRYWTEHYYCSWDLTQTLLNGALLLFLRLDPNAIERSITIVLETWPKRYWTEHYYCYWDLTQTLLNGALLFSQN